MEVIAHRGASAHRPEHTAAAYDLALAQGADTLELDVRATADGVPVVVHDVTLQRTAGCVLRVDRTTLTRMRALCGERAPLTLEEVLARYGAAARYLVELKDPDPAWEPRVVATLRRHGLLERSTIQSFDTRALRRLAGPGVACAPLVWRRRGGRALDALARYATGVGVWHRQIDRSFVAAAHARGLAVRAWTVNDPANVARLAGAGVDGVITDDPGVVAAFAAGPLRAAA